jgi:hypothetical protein
VVVPRILRGDQEDTTMRSSGRFLLVALVVLAALAGPARAGLIEFAIGVHGGIRMPIDEDGANGTVIGAKLRVLTPLPMIGVEGYYNRIGYEDPGVAWAQGDLGLALEGDTFDVFGADVLIGGVRGIPGFKWYGIVGVNFTEFEDWESNKELRTGGEIGVGLELVPPMLGFGFEARGTLVALNWGGDPDPKYATVTVGVNYYF